MRLKRIQQWIWVFLSATKLLRITNITWNKCSEVQYSATQIIFYSVRAVLVSIRFRCSSHSSSEPFAVLQQFSYFVCVQLMLLRPLFGSRIHVCFCIILEHINIILLEESQRYHELLSSAEITDENPRETMESTTSCRKGRVDLQAGILS